MRALGSIDIDSNYVAVIDRLAKAKPKHYDAERIVAARNWLHSYKCKLGRERNPHAPDDEIVAKFLSIAAWPRLEALLYDLMAERKEPGYNYGWFVTVALQRICGIAPTEQRKLRADLRAVPKLKPAPAEQQPLYASAEQPEPLAGEPTTSVADLHEQIARVAHRKAMR